MSTANQSPTPVSDLQGRRKQRDWTRAEEQHLVEILTEHQDWAAILIHNHSNDRVCGANKTAIAREIGLQLHSDDTPDSKVVLQKVKALKDRFKSWYDQMSQTGQGVLHGELHADSQLLRECDRILQEEPWFDQFHQLYIKHRPAQALDVLSGGSAMETVIGDLPPLSQLHLDSFTNPESQGMQGLPSASAHNINSDSDEMDLPSMVTLGEHHLATPAPSAPSSHSNASILSLLALGWKHVDTPLREGDSAAYRPEGLCCQEGLTPSQSMHDSQLLLSDR